MLALAIAPPARAATQDPRVSLLEAVQHNNPRAIRKLLAAGVSADIREKNYGPAIVMAAKLEAWDALAALADAPRIDLDASDAKGQSALMMAAIQGNRPAVELLLSRRARVDGAGSWTALHYAAARGHAEIARVLILHGANLDARSANGTTPAMLAARHAFYNTLELLAQMGADLSLRNDAGLGVIEYLAAHGEDARIAQVRKWIASDGR